MVVLGVSSEVEIFLEMSRKPLRKRRKLGKEPVHL